MALNFERPWALLTLPILVVVLFVLGWRKGRRGLAAAALRLVIAALLIVAAAGPVRPAALIERPRTILLVDRSASVGEDGLRQVQVALATAGLTPDDVVVIQFAQSRSLAADWTQTWPEFQASTSHTNLALALEFAGQLAALEGGPILLASDGVATTGDTIAAAEALAQRGLRVDIWPLMPAVGSDVAVEAVRMPGALWAGEPFSVTVNLYAQSATSATLTVRRDGAEFAQVQLDLTAGQNQVAFSAAADAHGLTALEVNVDAHGDARTENNAGGTVGLVRESPRVLIVASGATAAQALQTALAGHGVLSQVIEPGALPNASGALLDYQVLLLMNVPAAALSLAQQAALEAFTYADGHGLIFTGGPTAYSLGGFESTVLEPMLPVLLTPPPRAERPPASLLLIIDRSGSMSGDKLALVKEAAMRAAEILQPSDRVGVLAFDDKYEWSVPLTELGQGGALRRVLDSIGSLTSRGGTDMLTPLDVGIQAVAGIAGDNKHVVLLSDGISATGEPADFQRVVQAGLDAGVTVSTVSIGANSDDSLMSSIAGWGQGRFHAATDPDSLPRLLLAESQLVRSQSVQKGTIQPQIAWPHPLVSNFRASDFPPIDAYVALSPRVTTEAEVVLTSPLGDPLLAAWQYGLGRVVAWTSDVGGPWTPAWPDWPGLGRFWTQAVRYALPDPSQGPVFAEARAVGDEVSVTALASGADGKGLDLASARLVLAAPDGTRSETDLSQIAPGEYVATFKVANAGAYRGLVQVEKNGQRWETPVGFVAGYAPEFDPRNASGAATLAQIAAITGGDLLPVIGTAAARTSASAGAGEDYGPWLVLAALVLWPIEIAIRRRWMPWKG